MRTKTTLLCAAALAAGVVGSYAQSNVYSLNIVGYANVPTPKGYTYQSNPFEVSPSDTATNVIPNPNTVQQDLYSGPWDGSTLQTWTGLGWSVVTFDSETQDVPAGAFTGFVDNLSSLDPVQGPTLSSGLGYLINNVRASNNITYVGTVRTGTNAISYPHSGRPYAIGSPLPLAGGVSSTLGLSNPNTVQQDLYSGPLDGDEIEILTVNINGSSTGYHVEYFDSETQDVPAGQFTGFVDNLSSLDPEPEPQIPIGGGFFLAHNQTATYIWTQILNP